MRFCNELYTSVGVKHLVIPLDLLPRLLSRCFTPTVRSLIFAMIISSHDGAQNRFFIALMLPEEVERYANQVIEELSDRYHTHTAKAAPHITLQPPFLWPMDSTQKLEGAIATVAQTQSPIPIQLSGFGCFSPRVLYINVVKTPELLQAQKQLMGHLEETLNIVDKKAKHRPFAPHVTVASRNMTPAIFKQAWRDLQERAVRFDFVCDRLTLLIYNDQSHTADKPRGWHTLQTFTLLS